MTKHTDPTNPKLAKALAAAVEAASMRWPEEMRPRTVAQYLDTTVTTVYRQLARRPDFPKPLRRGTRWTAWLKADIDAWLAKQRRAA